MNKTLLKPLIGIFLTVMLIYSCDDDIETTPSRAEYTATLSIDSSGIHEHRGHVAVATISLDSINNTGSDIVVTYEIGGDHSNEDLVNPIPESVAIPNGEQSVTIDIEPIDDPHVEGHETIELLLLDVLVGGRVLMGMSGDTLTIYDDEIETFEASIATSSETATESETITITLTLDHANNTDEDIEVTYEVSGTATEGTDYETLSGSVTIADREDTGTFDIVTLDDSDYSDDETIIVTVSTSTLITTGSSSTASITISEEECGDDDSTDQDNHECDSTPDEDSEVEILIRTNLDLRRIKANGIPDHDYYNQVPNQVTDGLSSTTDTYFIDLTPEVASTTTDLTTNSRYNYDPEWTFGIALNGAIIDPAPATPFVYEDSDGEYNYNWIFEPNNNMDDVGLDCNIAHLRPVGSAGKGLFHYHGQMIDLPESLSPGISTGTVPDDPVLIGWAADGFPIVYLYGVDASGNTALLLPSYQVIDGERSGDGDSAPCGEYNGKYTNDYEYVDGLGDLDECNGIAREITIDGETFEYFYVITEDFPVISRCFAGTPSDDFGS